MCFTWMIPGILGPGGLWLASPPGQARVHQPVSLTGLAGPAEPRDDIKQLVFAPTKEMLSVKILEFLSSKRAVRLPRHSNWPLLK